MKKAAIIIMVMIITIITTFHLLILFTLSSFTGKSHYNLFKMADKIDSIVK